MKYVENGVCICWLRTCLLLSVSFPSGGIIEAFVLHLLISGEKRSALLAEVAKLRQERISESEEAAGEDGDYISQQPCRGTVGISNIQLPLKLEFVCSSRNRTGTR